MGRRALFFWLGVLGFLQITGASAEPSSAQKIEAIFNAPGFSGKPDLSIENKLVDLIQGTMPGGEILVAMYSFDHPRIARELLLASDRGVRVELVLDGKNKTFRKVRGHAVQILTSGYEGRPGGLRCKEGDCITYCSSLVGSGCQGASINHNKFFLFSKLRDGAHHVVAQSSYNVNLSQNFNYNDLAVIRNDERLYEGFHRYWHDLKRNRSKIFSSGSILGENGVRAYFFPRLMGKDPVLETLKKVHCEVPGSKIRIVQSRFDNSREHIALRLAELRQQGCDVKVVGRDEPRYKSPGSRIRALLGKDLILLRYQDAKGQHLIKNSIHSKLVLIDAALGAAQEKTPLVLTGSHNLNITSLKFNDEVLLALPGRETYERYFTFWNSLYQSAVRDGAHLSHSGL